jgi:hypothetical protein
MPINYLHICQECGESFSDVTNTPKDISFCPSCIMAPASSKAMEAEDFLGMSIQREGDEVHLKVTEANGLKHTEIIPPAIPRIRGRPRKVQIRPNNYESKMPPRNCTVCNREYQPHCHTQKACNLCRDGLKAARVKKRNDQVKEKRHAKGRAIEGNVRNWSLEQQATAMLVAAEPVPTPKKKPDPTISVETSGTCLVPGIIEVKRQPLSATYEGYWVLEKTGMTHDNRAYDIRKSPITGQIAICLCNPTEVYLSDATTQTPLG